ncbi:hypothetical protein [uncultured Zhongshania sp.]|uniref:hypothetical protein n=1 Tax=uncultured Zhongshania sp. TaxID=1642288 RepID=UPI0030D890E9|tara:strand:- start:28 stop:267 length:240 start_codon:yes stop_codon:yes gene_type:complete
MGENSDKDVMVYDRFSCENCADNGKLDFDFTMAFQPIVNCRTKEVFAYEALVRGLNNESAFSVMSNLNDDNRYLFVNAQ